MGKLWPIECDICKYIINKERFSDATCPNCGQSYEYDEGMRIVLTDEQKGILQSHFIKNQGKKRIE